jgi:hypothetical protein
VRGLRAKAQPDGQKPAWPGIDSTDSSAGRPPLTGLQRINIRWKAQGLRFSRIDYLEHSHPALVLQHPWRLLIRHAAKH